MKRHGLPVDVEAAKRQKQQLPSLLSTAPASLSLLSTVVLDNTDLFGLVASCLSFSNVRSRSRRDNSLHHFAACSRRTYSLVMRDGPWWKQQHVQLRMCRALVSCDKWSRLTYDDSSRAVQVDGFGARQQEVVRRLLGAEVYEREVAPRLSEVRTVIRRTRADKQGHMAMLGPKRRLAKPLPRVYAQLTPTFFDSLAQHLLESTRLPIVLSYNDSDQCRQWPHGCWDAVLLPKSAQWVGCASIDIDMFPTIRKPNQTACFFHALDRIPGVTQLTVRWQQTLIPGIMECPSLTSLSALTTALPKLASLHISRLPLQHEMVSSLTRSSALQHLKLEGTAVYGLDRLPSGLQMQRALHFDFPRQRPSVEQLRQQTADEDGARCRNHRLRQKLCAVWEAAVRDCLHELGDVQHLSEALERCADVRKQVQAEAAEAAGTSGGE